METQEFNKYLFNRIKKDLEKILLTKYKKHNFNTIDLHHSIKAPIGAFGSLGISSSIGYNEVFYLAEKHSGFNERSIENLKPLELMKYFKENLEGYKKYRKYNEILEHFYFPEDECYADASNHITKFVLKNNVHYWVGTLVKNYEELYKHHKKVHLFFVDYFYNYYDKLPIEIQKKGKIIYHEFELIKELKKNEKVLKLKGSLEKSLPKNNNKVKIAKI